MSQRWNFRAGRLAVGIENNPTLSCSPERDRDLPRHSQLMSEPGLELRGLFLSHW